MLAVSFSGARDVRVPSMGFVIASTLPVYKLETLGVVLMRYWETAGTVVNLEAHDTAGLETLLNKKGHGKQDSLQQYRSRQKMKALLPSRNYPKGQVVNCRWKSLLCRPQIHPLRRRVEAQCNVRPTLAGYIAHG